MQSNKMLFFRRQLPRQIHRPSRYHERRRKMLKVQRSWSRVEIQETRALVSLREVSIARFALLYSQVLNPVLPMV